MAATDDPTLKGDAAGLHKIVSSLPVDHSGTSVYLKGWRLESSAKPPLVIVHDLGEHAELYAPAAEAFARAAFTTYVFDLRGHGRSGRRLGHAPSFRVLVHDLLQVAAWVRHKEGGRAPVLLGHGIGALIVMEFTQYHGAFCRAAILSAPCLEPIAATGFGMRAALKILSEVAPAYQLPLPLFPRFARRLAAFEATAAAPEGESAAAPPRLTAVLAHELLLAIRRAEARFIEYHGSVLILCPEKDRVTSFAQLKKSAALHVEHNLRIVDLPGVGHQVLTADVAARALAMRVIIPWLEANAEEQARPPALPLLDAAENAATAPAGDAPATSGISSPRQAAKPGATKE